MSTIERAAELRDAFDQTFAQARRPDPVAVESLLAVRVGPDPYVLRMAEISGLFVDKRITRLPSSVAELSGIAGFRGTVLPVFDLMLLVGLARTSSPRWLVVTAAAPVALAFDGFDGYLNAPNAAIVPAGRTEAQHVREVVETADVVRPLISLASVLEWIRSRASRVGLDKEL